MAAPQPTSQSRADWYADPGSPGLIRYWDGAAWSVYTLPKPPGWDQRSPLRRTFRGGSAWWAVGSALVLFAPLGLIGLWRRPGLSTRLRVGLTVVLAAVLRGRVWPTGDETPSQEATDPHLVCQQATESPEPTPAVDVEAEISKPPKSTVPRVAGLAGKQAEKKLAVAGLVAFVAREVPSPTPARHRAASAQGRWCLRPGATPVGLVLAAPYPMVPGTAGMAQAAADPAPAQRRLPGARHPGGCDVRPERVSCCVRPPSARS